jgi:hypothetical protein
VKSHLEHQVKLVPLKCRCLCYGEVREIKRLVASQLRLLFLSSCMIQLWSFLEMHHLLEASFVELDGDDVLSYEFDVEVVLKDHYLLHEEVHHQPVISLVLHAHAHYPHRVQGFL